MIITMNFLDEIVEHKRRQIQRAKAAVPHSEMRDRALARHADAEPFALRAAVKEHKHQFAIIAEFKRASPSKGNIQLQADPAGMAEIFEQNGATAISVLTEEDYFRGSLKDLKAAKAAVSIPVLRKDFIIDEYQVFETAAAGADALLLIVAALGDEQLASLRWLAEGELQMDALVEVHTVDEMKRAASSGAKLIGVNNRNLGTFAVSLNVSDECLASAPVDSFLISESGLSDYADLQRLHAAGFQGFLIGEALMRAEDPGGALRALLGETSRARVW
jgi:indole-3-glycerol phosphate synthase